MKIKTEEHAWNVYEGCTWTAIDDDTYDGTPPGDGESGSPVGWGNKNAALAVDYPHFS
jgi:hypothetical protein